MKKDFPRRSKPAKNYRQTQGGWLSFLTGLAVGLFVALLVYLHGQTQISRDASGPETPQDLTDSEGQQDGASSGAKPKFDFYTILPEMEVKVPEWEQPLEPPAVKGEDKASGSYILQVGSFQKMEEADRVKANLAMLGLSASIQKVAVSGGDPWYRVRLGPFADMSKLQNARNRLVENNINFVMLKNKN
jgi:cell division protein FtsN